MGYGTEVEELGRARLWKKNLRPSGLYRNVSLDRFGEGQGTNSADQWLPSLAVCPRGVERVAEGAGNRRLGQVTPTPRAIFEQALADEIAYSPVAEFKNAVAPEGED